jgi:hypothetical protein
MQHFAQFEPLSGRITDAYSMPSDNFTSLERAIIVCLPNDRAATEAEVRDLAVRLRTAFPVLDDEFNVLLRQLHAKLCIEMNT